MERISLNHLTTFLIIISLISLWNCTPTDSINLPVKKDDHIIIVGNNLCSRMMNYSHFETEVHLRFPDEKLFIRNICDGGNTPGFRQHAGRFSPWAFPGAQQYQDQLAKNSDSQGHFPSPDQWLTNLEADIILAFFGYNESFQGEAGLDNFKSELDGFVKHTLSQQYNGGSAPQLVLVSPIGFEDLSDKFDLPDGMTQMLISFYTPMLLRKWLTAMISLLSIFFNQLRNGFLKLIK